MLTTTLAKRIHTGVAQGQRTTNSVEPRIGMGIAAVLGDLAGQRIGVTIDRFR
jgi:hypothetical protein